MELVSYLVGALSPVNHRGLHQGYHTMEHINILHSYQKDRKKKLQNERNLSQRERERRQKNKDGDKE